MNSDSMELILGDLLLECGPHRPVKRVGSPQDVELERLGRLELGAVENVGDVVVGDRLPLVHADQNITPPNAVLERRAIGSYGDDF